MKPSIKKMASLFNRRSRRGQSIIIITFAFIALIAFVGIATDVALLFVRYSTLRRAVDSAAIAAAGQVRETTDYVALNAVARQFIQVHGLDPSSVKVETCETEVIDLIKSRPGKSIEDPNDVRDANTDLVNGANGAKKSELCKPVPQKLVRVSAQVKSPTTFLSIFGFGTVTLQSSSVSQTAALDVALLLDNSLSEANDTFTDMTAYPVTECYSSFDSETFDASTAARPAYPYPPGGSNPYNPGDECNNSESLRSFGPLTKTKTTAGDGTDLQPMIIANPASFGLGLSPYPDALKPSTVGQAGMDAFETVWQAGGSFNAAANAATAAVDPLVNNYATAGNPGISTVSGSTLGTSSVRYECWYNPFPEEMGGAPGNPSKTKGNYNWAGCCNDPTVQTDDASGGVGFATGASSFNVDPEWYIQDDPAWPHAMIMTTGRKIGGAVGSAASVKYGGIGEAGHFKDFKGDGNFSDLICQPFKDVRDAARRFIKRLDFVRGDRLVLVTFAENAQVVKPYTAGHTTATQPIITDRDTAVRALNMQVGVAVQPNNVGNYCYIKDNHVPNPFVPDGALGQLDWMWTPVTDSKYFSKEQPKPDNNYDYWVVSQCSGSNTGGGVTAASNALVAPEYIRRDSVWVMVVLSDGFPNRTASWDPNGSEVGNAKRDWLIEQNQPGAGDNVAEYCDPGLGSPNFGTKPHWCAAGPYDWGYRAYDWTTKSTQGVALNSAGQRQMSYGFCPSWTRIKQTGAGGRQPRPFWVPYTTGDSYDTWATTPPNNPLCSDVDPDSRHFCMNVNGDINLDTTPADYQCDPRYDPDDYARDRVDFAALGDYTATAKGNFIAMYSIFFNREVDKTGDGIYDGKDLAENILGVKMMRYIADAGDNGKIDNAIQNWYRTKRDASVNPPPSGGFGYVQTGFSGGLNFTSTANEQAALTAPSGFGAQQILPNQSASNPAWGTNTAADPCAQYDVWYWNGGADVRVEPSSADYMNRVRTNCGQYFYAKDANAVNQAFVEISSRLFTRLSR